jgi:hypothetical protein
VPRALRRHAIRQGGGRRHHQHRLGSGHTYTFTRQPDGTTDIDVVIVRNGKNLKGRVLGFVLRTIGKRVLERAFVNSGKAIEARKGAAREAAVER